MGLLLHLVYIYSLLSLGYEPVQHVTVLNIFFPFLALQPPVGQGLLIYEVSRSHTTTQ